MGATLAMSQGRYGIITGKINRNVEQADAFQPNQKEQLETKKNYRRMKSGKKPQGIIKKNPEPLVIVSFPYASMEGYKIDVGEGELHLNMKGHVLDSGLHQRMG